MFKTRYSNTYTQKQRSKEHRPGITHWKEQRKRKEEKECRRGDVERRAMKRKSHPEVLFTTMILNRRMKELIESCD